MQLMTTIRRKQVRIIFHFNYLLCTGYVEKLVRHPPRLNSTLRNTVHHYTGATLKTNLTTHTSIKENLNPRARQHTEKRDKPAPKQLTTHNIMYVLFTLFFHENKL